MTNGRVKAQGQLFKRKQRPSNKSVLNLLRDSKMETDAWQIRETKHEGIFAKIIETFGRTRIANKIDRVVHNMLYS